MPRFENHHVSLVYIATVWLLAITISAKDDRSFGTFVPAVNRQLPGFDHANQGRWIAPFYFIHVTDIQFGFIAARRVPPGTGWSQEIDNANRFVDAVNSMDPKPKFVVMTGDLVDAMPGEESQAEQQETFRELFSELDTEIPFICLPGNHDVGDNPTSATISDYKANFGDDYFSFWVGGVKFIALNSQYLANDADPDQVAEQKAEQDEWLQNELSHPTFKPNHTILFQHIPWFYGSPYEGADMYNIPVIHRLNWLTRLKEAGVNNVFAGHMHQNAGGHDHDLEMTVTSALGAQLGNDEAGFRIVKVYGDQVAHEYVELDKPPVDISL
ncbi:serine/threonine-protein phosphatase CPPED1-like [Lineus longissimus]|uniref:serine/threonine-protein phosphatase CPPED1-like n=1 Tax=Lineus longissimus TaxID=88925 RepID=UPI002B4D161D